VRDIYAWKLNGTIAMFESAEGRNATRKSGSPRCSSESPPTPPQEVKVSSSGELPTLACRIFTLLGTSGESKVAVDTPNFPGTA